MSAAVVDHTRPETRTVGLATFRFWRDLGYAVGTVAGAGADASSPESVFLVFAVAVSLTGVLVARTCH